jgi:hypothetical protein
MELSSPHWTFDPTAFTLDPSVAWLCDLRLDILDDVNLEALRSGLWWVYPIGRSFSNSLIGLRLRPGTPLARSPVVSARGAEAVTLCSSPAYLVPTLVFNQMLIGEPRWREVAKLSAADWAPAIALHRALGGGDDLEGLRAVAADRALAASIAVGADDYERWVHAVSGIKSRLDAAPETATYWRYAAAVAITKSATPLPDAGGWNGALAALAFYASRDEGAPEAARALQLEAAWRMMQAPPALDTSRSGTGIALVPSSHKSVELGVSAAKVVAKRKPPAWTGDPLLPAIEQLATTKPYDGAAHALAASILARAGDPERAFDALTAAAYWSFHASGSAQPDALDAAVGVARHAGSTDVADALEQLRDARAQLEAEAQD